MGAIALNNALTQIKSSDEMRGRMVSLSSMTFGIMPLSAVPFGAVAEHIGPPYSLIIAGSVLCAFMLIFFISARDSRRSAQ
ncbi:MAG: MFS transporter [Clostridiaceae bacterium]|nr:MFS transporter [Clostridiaceae bacterium]